MPLADSKKQKINTPTLVHMYCMEPYILNDMRIHQLTYLSCISEKTIHHRI